MPIVSKIVESEAYGLRKSELPKNRIKITPNTALIAPQIVPKVASFIVTRIVKKKCFIDPCKNLQKNRPPKSYLSLKTQIFTLVLAAQIIDMMIESKGYTPTPW